MKITKFIHSCLIVEIDDKKIIIDPGNYTYEEGVFKLDEFDRLDYLIRDAKNCGVSYGNISFHRLCNNLAFNLSKLDKNKIKVEKMTILLLIQNVIKIFQINETTCFSF